MSITVVLRSPTVACKGKYAPFLLNITRVLHTASIFFVPLIYVSGSVRYAYFYFVISLRPIPYPSSDMCRWLFLIYVLPFMFMRIYSPIIANQ